MLTLLRKNSILVGADRLSRLTRIATHYLSALILMGINQRGLIMKRHTTKDLSQSRLKELFKYSPETGDLVRIKQVSTAKVGDIAGTPDKQGYLKIRVDCKTYTASRLAFLYMVGYFPENDIDHINRNPSDNRWLNLREVSHGCNIKNCPVRSTNNSGVTGVCWSNNRWRAEITSNYKKLYIGSYEDFCSAVKARWIAEKEFNFPSCNTSSSAFLYLKERGLT